MKNSDLIIRNGRVIDGSGSPAQVCDIAVKGGTIAKIGDFPDDEADKEIDALPGKLVRGKQMRPD